MQALISAETLFENLQRDDLLIIDLRSEESFNEGHIPGAVLVPPAKLSCGIKPAPGKLPSKEALTELFQSIGLTPDKHVITYDDAGSSWAGRMIWTLDIIGHSKSSLLDGGINAWKSAGFETTSEIVLPIKSGIDFELDQSFTSTQQDIMEKLGEPHFKVWDARTEEEYLGTKVQAARGGHIPGAIHLEWTDLTDNEGRVLPLELIQTMLDNKGLSKDKVITTHCQTHRRSGLTYFVAKKLLNYPDITAYPGSWSEWGNDENTPIETGPGS